MKFGNLIKCAAWIAALASVFACAKEVVLFYFILLFT